MAGNEPSSTQSKSSSSRESVTPKSGPAIAPQSRPPSSTGQDAPQNRSSWYGRTWPRKATPVTQVARESIASASNTAIEIASTIADKTSITSRPQRRSSLALTLGHTKSRKSLPVTATATKDNVMPHGRRASSIRQTNEIVQPSQSITSGLPTTDPATSPRPETVCGSKKEPKPQGGAPQGDRPGNSIDSQSDVTPRSWIGWLAGSDGKQSQQAPTTPAQIKTSDVPRSSQNMPQVSEEVIKPTTQELPATNGQKTPEAAASIEETGSALQRRSWLPIWHNSTATQSAPAIASPAVDASPKQESPMPPQTLDTSVKSTTANQPEQAGPSSLNDLPTPLVEPAPKPATWLFWSREKTSDTKTPNKTPERHEALASDTDVQTGDRKASPASASSSKPASVLVAATKDSTVVKASKKDPKANASGQDLRKAALENGASTTKVEGKTATATAVAPAEALPSRTASPTPSRKQYEHILLPPLDETLKLPENPTLLQQLTRLFYPAKDPQLKYLSLVKDPPRIRNALVIGVHGYFPAPLIQSVLGRPTGTSIKFADMAAKSIKQYTRSHGYDCSVKTAALEGEGRIAERIDLLWKLLLNWIDDIRKADFIFVASHSQGVPVAIMLVAKLIHFGCIGNARVGLCAMAGVNAGPFPEYKSRWISGSSAGELFEFADPSSKVSKDYLAALDDVLKFGARLTYVGSIDDQLVSMDSSIHAPISHPHIYRAVSIDSRLNAPDFVSHLVAFTLKLRNLGVQDHGLIKELSTPLAGSLYTGDGHSRIYEDAAIYNLAITFALETTSMPGTALTKRDADSNGTNPYILPFAMRGILEEDFVKSDLQDEAVQLLKQFDDWKPQTKALKDVKFRLEGIRSKL